MSGQARRLRDEVGIGTHTMLNVYLDQNKWISLALAHHGKPGGETHRDVLAAANEAVQQGHARFPLSMSHYMETWNRRDDASRRELSSTMWLLASAPEFVGPYTMLCFEDIIRFELEACLAQRQQLPPLVPPAIFGDGFGHIITDPTWRRITPDAFADAPPAAASLVDALRAAAERSKEWFILCKDSLGEDVSDENEGAYFRVSQSFLQLEHTLQEHFRQQGYSRRRRRVELARQIVFRVLDIIADVVQRTRADPRALGDSNNDDEVIALVTALPTLRVHFEALALSFDNPQFPRARGDMDDVVALSCATVHCDIVVAERTWGDMIKRTRLPEEHGTIVINDLRELIPLLRQ
jgi:hypothetical protein